MGFVSWLPNAGGDWDVLTNWSAGVLPTSADQVTISTTTIQTITHLIGNDYASSLSVGKDLFEMEGGTLGTVSSAAFGSGFTMTAGAMTTGAAMSITSGATAISGGTLTVGTTLKITGTLDQTGGTITAKSVTVTGAAELLGGSLIGATTFQATGLVTLADYTFLGSAQLTNAHTLDQTGTVTLGDNSGVDATITNKAGATYNFDNAVSIDSGAATAEFVNSGTLAAVAETGTSTIDVQAKSTGTISIGADSTLAFAGLGTSLGGTISGAGTLGVSGGVTTIAASAKFTVSALSLSGDGVLSLGASETLSGDFTESDDSTLELNSHTLTLSGAATFSGTSVISDGGTLATDDDTTISGDLTIDGGIAWTNSATITVTESFQIGNGSGKAATLTNASAGVFDFLDGGVSVNIGSGAGKDSLVNAGTLEMTASSGVSHVYAAVTNSGTITATGGTLEIDGALSNSKTVTTDGGDVTLDGNVTNTSSIDADDDIITVNGKLTNKSKIGATDDGDVYIDGALTNTGTITASAGSYVGLSGGGTLGGTIGGGGGSVVLTGTYTVVAGKTDSVKFGSGVSFAATGTSAAYLSGAGTIVTRSTVAIGNNGRTALSLEDDVIWQNDGTVNDSGDITFGGSDGDNVTLDNASGATFNITANGTIEPYNGIGGGTIENAGTFEKSAGTGVSDIDDSFTNTGTIEAKSGTLEFEDGGTLGGTIGGGAGDVVLEGTFALAMEVTIGGGAGDVTLAGTFSVAMGATEAVTFGSGVSFAATGTSSAYLYGAGTITTSGTVGIDNNGRTALSLEDDVIWQNDGTVNDGGDITFGGSDGDNVTLDNASGATFKITVDGTIIQPYNGIGGGTFENAGTFEKSAGTGVSYIEDYFTNTGTIEAESGTLEFDEGGTLGGTIGGGAGKVVLDGYFNVATGKTETVTFGTGVSFAAVGTSTAYLYGAGTIATSGTVAIGNNGRTALSLYDDVIWQNDGTVNDGGDIAFGDSDGDSDGDNVTLDNASGATFNITVDGTIIQPYRGGSGTIENAGTFEKSAGTGVSYIEDYFTNTGTIEAESGTLEFDDGGTLGGTIGGGAGKVVLDGYFNVATGKTETVTFGTGVSFAATGTSIAYLYGAGTIATSGTIAIGNNGGTALELYDDVIWQNDGTVNDGGDVSLGASSADTATLDNASGATFNITVDGAIFQSYYGRGDGTIENAGTFDKSAGTGVSDIEVAVANTGTIEANSGTLDLQDALTGIGDDSIGADGTLEVDSTVAATQTFTYAAAGGGDLVLGDLDVGGAQLFEGTISGFAAGDELDLGTPFGTGTTFVYTENAGLTGGTLAITDGTLQASISFLGNYTTASFTPATDNNGGTLLTFHA